jgi:hypothetical protein
LTTPTLQLSGDVRLSSPELAETDRVGIEGVQRGECFDD